MKRVLLVLLIMQFCLSNAAFAGWSLISGTISSNDLRSVHLVNSNTGFVVGTDGMILKTTNAGSSWANVSSSANFETLNDVHFTNLNLGWAVGNYGTIMKTVNSGNSWTLNTTATINSINSVYFVSDAMGWICGDFGTIMKTIDGGSTWTLQTSNTMVYLHDIFFVDSQLGWAVGQGGVMLKTTDGGTTWALQNPSPTMNQLESVFFVNSNIGWAAGQNNTLIKTTNGGTTWSLVGAITGNIAKVQFLDAQNGYLNLYSGQIYKSTDGGITWAMTYNPGIWARGMHFANVDNGLVVGEYGTIFSTSNAATSWTSNLANNPTNNQLNSVYFANPIVGWAAGGNGTLLKSTDSGNSWESLTSLATSDFNSLAFPTATIGYAVGESGSIFKTVDGGTSWTSQTSGVVYGLKSAYFENDQIGWAVGHLGTIIKTTNGGTTWAAQTSGVTSNLLGITFIDANTGWAVGAFGTILKTTNAGTSWVSQTSGTNYWLYDVKFINTNIGWAVGSDGTILKTTNGGTSWVSQISGVSDELQSVSFTDADNGVAVGLSGIILHTSNGGTNWALQTQITSNSFYGVYFDNQNLGWAVGQGGTIAKYVAQAQSVQPSLMAPLNASTNIQITPNFAWHSLSGFTGYRIQVSGSNTFATIIKDTTLADTLYSLGSALNYSTEYFWRVKAVSASDTSDWSAVWNFTTEQLIQRVYVGDGIDFEIAQPMDRFYNYSTHEAIYKSADLGGAKILTSIGYNKGYGDDLNPIENVSIYFKHTTNNEFTNGNYSTAGYTMVYQGNYPNNVLEGWLDVTLQTPFFYNGTNNLQVLVVKGYQASVGFFDAPSWRFTFSLTNDARSSSSDVSQPNFLDALPFVPDIRFAYEDFALATPVLVSPENQSVSALNPTLNWENVSFALSYQVQLSLSNTFGTLLTNQTLTTNSFATLNLLPNTEYFWRVRALHPLDTSEWSEIWSFTTQGPTTVTQFIPLNVGWNFISANVEPSDANMSAIFGQLGNNLILAKSMNGAIYAPPFNTSLSVWNNNQAYMVKVHSIDTLSITGTPIVPELSPIVLNQSGWYWLPYFRTSAISADAGLYSIFGKYAVVFDQNGNFHIPMQGSSTLQQLHPGKGYLIRLTANDGTLTYPAN